MFNFFISILGHDSKENSENESETISKAPKSNKRKNSDVSTKSGKESGKGASSVDSDYSAKKIKLEQGKLAEFQQKLQNAKTELNENAKFTEKSQASLLADSMKDKISTNPTNVRQVSRESSNADLEVDIENDEYENDEYTDSPSATTPVFHDSGTANLASISPNSVNSGNSVVNLPNLPTTIRNYVPAASKNSLPTGANNINATAAAAAQAALAAAISAKHAQMSKSQQNQHTAAVHQAQQQVHSKNVQMNAFNGVFYNNQLANQAIANWNVLRQQQQNLLSQKSETNNTVPTTTPAQQQQMIRNLLASQNKWEMMWVLF